MQYVIAVVDSSGQWSDHVLATDPGIIRRMVKAWQKTIAELPEYKIKVYKIAEVDPNDDNLKLK